MTKGSARALGAEPIPPPQILPVVAEQLRRSRKGQPLVGHKQSSVEGFNPRWMLEDRTRIHSTGLM